MVTIKAPRNGAVAEQPHLTPAEWRVLVLLPTHLTLEAIAERLGRRRSTVKTHIAHIYKKLGAGTRCEAVEQALKAGLLDDPHPAATPHVKEATQMTAGRPTP